MDATQVAGARPVAPGAASDGGTQELPSDGGLTERIDASSAKTRLVGVGATRVEVPGQTQPVDRQAAPPEEDFSAEAGEAQRSLEGETTAVPPIRTQGSQASVRPSAEGTSGASPDGGSKGHLSKGVVALIVVAVALAVAAVAYATYSAHIWGGVEVPDVVGKDVDDARDVLTQAGFPTATVDAVSDDQVGKVISSDPAAGTRSDTSKTVTLSVGVARTVPDVVGLSLDDAKKKLSDAGYTNISTAYESSDKDEGTVTAVTPGQGATAKATDAIALTVAQAYTVPDVLGLAEADATAAIEKAGLKSNVTYQESDKTAGTVLAVSPDSGTRMQGGATVELTVAKEKSVTPSDPYQVATYLSMKPEGISSYLVGSGWALKYGTAYNGVAEEILTDGTTVLTFTGTPLSHHHGNFGQDSSYDALAQGASVSGVRLETLPDALGAKQEVSDDVAKAVMRKCGLDNVTSSCKTSTFIGPQGANPSDFVCLAGTQGDMTWSVLVYDGSAGITAAVTCLPTTDATSSYYDTSSFGSNYADLVAYYDLCTE
ncbi:MAG: PASTA domain-containing protein [Atopobiaceae bacterium]|jgi:beta-lactam-binding protein with PASTA domain|nr:PASTA domain-containing protein [Atopobiaceae bacterium]MCH4214671.1 PASTA domain-containing protein [Atopobiaceae bacterium]MCH4230598.1 PASTA domain-containing protein [Atopobiaceae bacterium]MCH4276717.1 PASTA domain-containing protein [Atopobiaceae bacterium]MCI1226635.1 PASTA domain-containing protein [Atopobiaceae bacterium]